MGKGLGKRRMHRDAGTGAGARRKDTGFPGRHRMSGYAEARTHLAALTSNT